MKLTCVTATFNCVKVGNREQLIRCVESVAKLKIEHEHLIYDGASTDGTVELLRELEAKTSGLKVVSEPDAGIYNALNKGVRDAHGEWFYVLGADDYISHPEVMDALLAEYDCDAIVAPAEQKHGFRDITIKSIFLSMPYCHQGVIQKTSAIRSLGAFDEEYKIVSDFDLVLKFHMSGLDIKYVNRPFAFFCDEGLSSVLTEKMSCEMNKIIATHFNVSVNFAAKMRKRGFASLRMVSPYFSHADFALSKAAWYSIYDNIKGCCRMIFYPLVLVRRRLINSGNVRQV